MKRDGALSGLIELDSKTHWGHHIIESLKKNGKNRQALTWRPHI